MLLLCLLLGSSIVYGQACKSGDQGLFGNCIDYVDSSPSCSSQQLSPRAYYNCMCSYYTSVTNCYNQFCPGDNGIARSVDGQLQHCGNVPIEITLTSTLLTASLTSSLLSTVTATVTASLSSSLDSLSSMSFLFAVPTSTSSPLTGLPPFPNLKGNAHQFDRWTSYALAFTLLSAIMAIL